ncbi:MAG: membrane protein insertion efficiency factor YidD [Culicoidibacterales bacterium]
MKWLLIIFIRFYQRVLSPLKTHQSCLFMPTCSQYMIEAIQIHGVFKGLYLGCRRIGRCRPGSGCSGYDPVPQKESSNSDIPPAL